MARFNKALLALVLTGCGGGTSFSPAPINLSVSVNNATITVPNNGTLVNLPVTIVAPTETASFSITGLPAGVTDTYKESESNPSGLLTLSANTSTVRGTYRPTITVGSLGQTASVVFVLVISAPNVTHSFTARPQSPPKGCHPPTADLSCSTILGAPYLPTASSSGDVGLSSSPPATPNFQKRFPEAFQRHKHVRNPRTLPNHISLALASGGAVGRLSPASLLHVQGLRLGAA